MSGANRLFSYFPLLMTVLTFAALGVFARGPSFLSLVLVLAVIYVLPPLALRIMLRWAAIVPGIATIDERKFSAWLAAHHIQALYDALPQLEALLRVIPGFYSMWLRLWGSHIGYGVEWPVRMDVLDRNMMDIGNRVVFARDVELAAHVRSKSDSGASRVLARPIRIGSYAFLGAGARLGPGASVPSNASVPEMAIVGVNVAFGSKALHPTPDEAQFAFS